MKLSSNKINDLIKDIKIFSQTDYIDSEENTKKRIIEPLIEMLGWNFKEDIQLEYQIHIGRSLNYVDYAMSIKGKPVLFLEAKALSVNLSNDESTQIISYGRVEAVRWVALTNGKLVKIFDTTGGRTEKECIIAVIELLNLPSHSYELGLISKNSILTGEIENAAKRLLLTKKAIDSLIQRKDEIAQEFRISLLKATGIEIKDKVDTISKRLVEIAVQSLDKDTELFYQQKMDNDVKLMTREELTTKSDGEVILCLSRIEGIDFLKRYNAWGFINMNKQVPYFALYVGKPESSIKYFGEVNSITERIQSKEDIKSIDDDDKETFQAGKRLIYLKPGSLVKFKDPIPLKTRTEAPRGIRYTTLSKLIKANCIEEL